LSTIAELQPYWIHRLVKGSEMIDNMGHKVISSNRGESNQGLTPGGCFDNPEVLQLMEHFLRKVAKRYKDHPALIAWDAWNETRWEVCADGLVCYCPHTIKLFKEWLNTKYDGLEGLNQAWKRRYDSWDDVLPGKTYGRTYSEMVDWALFFIWRQNRHLQFRYMILKEEDPNHIVSVHGPCPTMYHGAWEPNGESMKHLSGEMDHTIFHRGNDWDMADIVDALGTSNFPISQKNDPMEYGGRVEMIRSATRRRKQCWISELQGGRVSGPLQQIWLWTSYARGAKAVIFWNWRGEVFGRESGAQGGIIGLDGNEIVRCEELNKAGKLLREYEQILDSYQPDDPRIAVFFDESTWCIEWARTGRATESFENTIGYVRALEKAQLPYTFLESKHLDYLEKLKLLIMPNAKVVCSEAASKISAFVKNGGWIILEGDADSFLQQGFYRYLDERSFVNSFGIQGKGIRTSDCSEIFLKFNDKSYNLKTQKGDMWIPFSTGENVHALSKADNDEVIAVIATYGKGKVICYGNLLGKSYYHDPYKDFEDFIKDCADEAHALPDIKISTQRPLQWRHGMSGDTHLLFLINSSETQYIELFLPSCQNNEITNIKNNEKLALERFENGWKVKMKVEGLSYNILSWN
ncbi:MAG: alpha-amylase family protein, partial [Armatimonadota bacterium]